MKTRIITAAVGLCVLAVVMLMFNTLVFEAVVALIAIIAVHEIYKAFALGEKESHIFIAFIPYTFLVMFSHVPVVKALLVPGSYLLAVYLAVCLLWHNRTLSAAKLGGMVVFSGMMISCFYSIVFIKNHLNNQFESIYLIMMILCFAWGGDSAAYFAGRYFGKHKLAPVVSPHKTIEGAIGGVLGSGVLGVLCTLAAQSLSAHLAGGKACLLLERMSASAASYLVVFILGMLCSLLGILGDLFASAVKRQCAIKDYGTIFPGHGGIMDRFDSVTFIAPAAALLVWLTTTFLK